MLRKLLNVFHRNRLDRDLREELEFHRSQSSGHLGNISLIEDRMRDASTLVWLETLVQDIRYGFRQLRKSPVLVATAVLSLALGIGANTAIFSLINAITFQSLPVRDPARLVLFYDGVGEGVYSGNGFGKDEFSYASYQYLRAHNDSFEDLCAFRQGSDRVVLHLAGTHDGGPWETAEVHLVSGNYFDVLGVDASAGRLLQSSDDSPSAPPTAVLSYPFWRDRFHASPEVIGQTVILNGTAFTIAGVAAREFFGERIQTPPDFWVPLSFQPQVLKSASYLTDRHLYWLNFLGRLKAGVTLSAAQASTNLRIHQFYLNQVGSSPSAQTRREIEDVQLHLTAGGGGISDLRFRYSEPLHILMAVVAVVLLIACANVATLLLARASARRPEFLARLALGASQERLLRQVLTESILLSVVGGLVSIVFAWCSLKLLQLVIPLGSMVTVHPDPLVMAFTIGLSLFTGILFGIFPALKYSRIQPRSTAAVPRFLNTSQSLVACQIALSLILLVGAGLLARSLLALETQNLGFERNNIVVIHTDAGLAGYQSSELFPLYRDLGDRLQHLPGIISAGLARFTPFSGYVSCGDFAMQGYTPRAGLDLNVYDLAVAPGYLETLGIPLLLGRTIGIRDTPAASAVALVNQTFVRTYFPQGNPIGQHLSLGTPFKAPGAEIVGVVADAKFYELREKTPPMVFFAFWQNPTPGIHAVIRTSANPSGVMDDVRRTFKQVNNRLPILSVSTLNGQIEKSLDQQKAITALCSAFGVLALLLAAIGIYGTLAYAVSGRTKEIGVRVAIGAQRRHVTWLVLRDSLLLIAVGLVLGVPLALIGTRWLKSFLFGVAQIDPIALASSMLLIVALALLAGYLPARRAARIDPIRALRQE